MHLGSCSVSSVCMCRNSGGLTSVGVTVRGGESQERRDNISHLFFCECLRVCTRKGREVWSLPHSSGGGGPGGRLRSGVLRGARIPRSAQTPVSLQGRVRSCILSVMCVRTRIIPTGTWLPGSWRARARLRAVVVRAHTRRAHACRRVRAGARSGVAQQNLSLREHGRGGAL